MQQIDSSCHVNSKCVIRPGMKSELNVDQIKKLWLLELILESGSFKGAAARAKISPSAVSQAVTALEKNVGKPLIVRGKGHVTPTEEAIAILRVVRPAFAAFKKLGELGSQPVPKLTWLNFGAYESIAMDILPGLLHRLREVMPGLRLSLRIGRTSQLLTMVRRGELCSALVTEVDDSDRMYKVNVAEDRLGVFVSARHPVGEMSFAEACAMGLGSLAPGKDGLPRYFTRFMRKLDSCKATVLSESFETLGAATASGVIAAVLPALVAKRIGNLREITPANCRGMGQHQIYVVSQPNCDREEADFLAYEARRLFASL